MFSIIDRYLLKEILKSAIGVTMVLLIILISTRFARFIAEAASGSLPKEAVFLLLGLTTLQYLLVIVPPAFFLAVILALGRLYRDSEMAALGACGVGAKALLKPILMAAFVFTALVAWLALIGGPWTGDYAYKLRAEARHLASVGLVEPGVFKSFRGGQGMFYVQQVDEQENRLENIFVYLDDGDIPSIITAQTGWQTFDKTSGERTLILQDGYRYEGQAGESNYQIVAFKEHGVRVQMPEKKAIKVRRSVQPTQQLWASADAADHAELAWRFALPFTIIILALLALPLSYVEPRQGRYAKLLMAVLIYVIYFNALGMLQRMVEKEQIALMPGVWPVHILMGCIACWLIWRRYGTRKVKRSS